MSIIHEEPHNTEKVNTIQVEERGVCISNTLPDLNTPFKAVVTEALQEILQQRPEEPIRVLTDRLRESSEHHKTEKHTCVLGDNLLCTVKKACTHINGAEILQVSELCLLQLVMPTAFELDAAFRHLDTIATPESKIIVFIEPPNPPIDLFFLSGVPYVGDITEQLLQKRRRGVPDKTLNACVGSPDKIISLVRDAFNMSVKTLHEEMAAVATPASRFSLVELPSTQCDFLKTFDIIDAALGVKRNLWQCNAVPLIKMPTVVFASFEPSRSSMTLSRIIAAMLPLYEQVQHSNLTTMLERKKAYIRQLDFKYVTNYWKEVLERRVARDQARGLRRENRSCNRSTSQQPFKQRKNMREKSTMSPVNIATTQRRDAENVAFLRVLQRLRSQAAIHIQALYRGYSWRKRMPWVLSNQTKAPTDACWVEDLPPSVPPLLRRCSERLSAIHGEVFGNYAVSCPPVPRYVTVFKPQRKKIIASGTTSENENSDVESETESWKEEKVVLPMKRQTRYPPHFNPLRRLMECEFLSKRNTIQYASAIQREYGGLSVLQRRAYDYYKSLTLNILHIAYLELRHRGMLPLALDSFVDYVNRFHVEVLGWFSAPHLFSRVALQDLSSPSRSASVLSIKEVLETERVILAFTCKESRLYARSTFSKQKHVPLDLQPHEHEQYEKGLLNDSKPVQHSGTLHQEKDDQWNCVGVYAAPAFLSEFAWERALRELLSKNGSETKVAWWSLYHHPAVYINGDPFVLAPREEHQEVEGRSRFDELVPRIVEVTAKKADSVCSRNPAEEETSHPLNCTKVSSDIYCQSLSPDRPSEINVSTPLPTNLHTCTDSISVFGCSLEEEDLYLTEALRQDAARGFPMKLERYCTEVPSAPYSMFTVFSHQQPLVKISSLGAMSRDIEKIQCASHRRDHSFGSNSSLLHMEEIVFQPKKREISELEQSSQGQSPHSSSSKETTSFIETSRCTPLPSSVSNIKSLTQVGGVFSFDSVTAMAHCVASRVLNKENFLHKRPWLTPVCGRAWLRNFDQLIPEFLIQMRAGCVLVLAVDNLHQFMIFNSVCLLKHAIFQCARATQQGLEKVNWTGVPKKKEIFPSLLTPDTAKCLSFINTFYEILNDLVRDSCVSVSECVHTVQQIIQHNAPKGLQFLEELTVLIRSAERETNRRLLVETILTVVQRVEIYCWLVLFQVFLSLQASTGVFEDCKQSKLSPFSIFADITALQLWMEHIDPWCNASENSPDPFHLRYSNGLRRWDDMNYIFCGAL